MKLFLSASVICGLLAKTALAAPNYYGGGLEQCLDICKANWEQHEVNCGSYPTEACKKSQCDYAKICFPQCYRIYGGSYESSSDYSSYVSKCSGYKSKDDYKEDYKEDHKEDHKKDNYKGIRHAGTYDEYYPPCKNDYTYEYGSDGYRYGYEEGHSCLYKDDYYKVYGYETPYETQYETPYYPEETPYSEPTPYYPETTPYYSEETTPYYSEETPAYKDTYKGVRHSGHNSYKQDYFPKCKNKYGGYEYGSDGYRYGYEYGQSCLVEDDYYKVYGGEYKKSYLRHSGSYDSYKKDDYYKDEYKKDEYKKQDYFPKCKDKYGGYEYGSDGYRYGYEDGKSCLVEDDYYKVYGGEYKKSYLRHSGSYDSYKKDDYYKDEYKKDQYKKQDYFPKCKDKYGGYEYGSDGYRYGYEDGKSCLVEDDYYKVYGKY